MKHYARRPNRPGGGPGLSGLMEQNMLYRLDEENDRFRHECKIYQTLKGEAHHE